jgi:putative ABC transport system permease protein
MGIPLEHGRLFDRRDDVGPPVAIINDVAAQRYFGGRDAVGQRITFRGPATIVGIVKSVRLRGPEAELRPELYVPVEQEIQAIGGAPFGILVARVDEPTPQLAMQIAAALQPAVGARPVDPRSLDEAFSELTQDRRFNAGLLSIFGVISTVIGAIGIYGVMAFAVAQQVRTIGLQIALGATRQRVLRDVLKEAGRYVLVGVALGLAGARAMSDLFTSLVFGVTETDLRVYLVVAAFLAALGLVAALAPAVRAARIDPLRALRLEN